MWLRFPQRQNPEVRVHEEQGHKGQSVLRPGPQAAGAGPGSRRRLPPLSSINRISIETLRNNYL